MSSTITTEGSMPVESTHEIVMSLQEFTNKIGVDVRGGIDYLKVELVEGKLRWKIIERR